VKWRGKESLGGLKRRGYGNLKVRSFRAGTAGRLRGGTSLKKRGANTHRFKPREETGSTGSASKTSLRRKTGEEKGKDHERSLSERISSTKNKRGGWDLYNNKARRKISPRPRLCGGEARGEGKKMNLPSVLDERKFRANEKGVSFPGRITGSES